jgi:DnaJ-class molecular chaperone
MSALSPEAVVTCPACGGAGGGPIGRAGSAWDDETYVCPRCRGRGAIAADEAIVQRPGIVKAVPGEGEAVEKKRKASG